MKPRATDDLPDLPEPSADDDAAQAALEFDQHRPVAGPDALAVRTAHGAALRVLQFGTRQSVAQVHILHRFHLALLADEHRIH
jgi:hypothetical protein